MYRVRKDYDKKKWDEDRDRIIARYYYNKYNESITGLDNDFNKNLSVLEKFDMKTWNELDSIKTQDVYYNALKERQKEIKQQLLKHKSIYISGYGEENYNTMLKNVKRLGKKINRITGLLSETNDFYGQFLNEQEFNDYKQFNNMKEKYGDLSDYDSWVNASNTAVGDEKEWLEKYPIYYGYANQDFRDKYLEKLHKGIDNAKSLKEYGFTLREKITALQTEMMNAETEYWKYKSGSEERNKYAKIMEDAKKKLDEIYDQVGETIFNASTSDIYYYDDKIKNAENKKAEFESVVNYYSETLPFTKVTQNDDFKSVVRDIDTTDYLKKLKTDIVDGKSDTKAGKYLTDEMREEFKEYFDGMDISLLRESERQILVYNFEKMKDAVTAGGGYDKISDDDALTAGYHMGLNKSFLKLINENHYLEQREQQNEYEYYKNAPDWKQAIHSVLSVPANLAGSILSIPYTLGTGIAGGEINPYSNWYWLQNYASAVTGGVSADLEQKYGSAGPEIYGYGIAGLELLTEIFATRGLGKLASLPTKAMSYIQGSLTASRAFSGTVVDAKKRGLSDEQALLLGGISATAEFATEKIGFDRMMKSLGKKGIQKLTKSFVAKEIVINAVSEGAEELSSDVINWVADIIVSKDKSQWEQSIQSYIIEGDDYSTACNKAFKDAAWQMGSSFLGGFLIGGAFGGVSSAVKYKKIKNLGKNLVNNNQYDNVMNIAQQADDGSNSDILLKQLSDGKISNAQLGQLAIENYKDNSEKIVQIQREIIENTIAQRYAEAGGNNDSSIDVIMKVLSGEKVNKTETDIIQNDDTAKQIFNEILKMDSWVVQAFEKANTATQDLQKNNSVLMGQAENINSNVSDGINEQNGFVENKIKTDNKLATIRSQAKSETALNDLTEHIDDTYYKVVYNETVNSEGSDNPSTAVRENTVSAKSDGNSISVEERSAEFNRIYDMGIDEDIPPHEITSDIFTPEQVRRIYAAAVVDDNIRNKYGNKVSFTELLKEYEDKAAIAQFGNETVKNIMTASAEQVHACAKKLGINVEFVNKVPGKNPNADGAYDPKTNTLYINKNTKYPMQQVFLHELTHFFESADNYSEFQNTVFKSRAFKKWLGKYTNLKNDRYKSIDEYRNALKERYGENDDTKINKEMVAFFVSDNLFQKDFGDLGRLATELTGSKKERFISFIKNIFKRFKNAVSGIDKLEKKFLSLYRTAGQNKNTDSNNGVKQMNTGEKTAKIQVGMSDSERTEILKNKSLTVAHYQGQADEVIKDNKASLESQKTGIVKKALKKVADSFGNYGDYNVKDFDVEVSYSNNSVKESVAKVTDKKTLAKLFPIIDKAIENAIGINSENNRYYYDKSNLYYHTLLSGYIDGDYFIPIRFGVKENNQGENKLYIMVGQNKIDLKVLKLPAHKNEVSNSRLRSNISISEIFKNVNSKDLLRYIPDDMINAEQRKIKYEGIAETIKYTNDKNDRKYAEYIAKGDLASAKKMVEAKAKDYGYTIKACHGTAVDLSLKPKKYGDAPFYVFNSGNDDLIHFGTEEQAFTRGRQKYERKNEMAYWYTFECYLKINNPYQTYDKGLNWKETVEYANKNGYDGIIYENEHEGNGLSYAVFNSNQIKSAEPIVYDDNGNVIPLSERFNEDNNDIRYMLSEEDKFDNFGNYFDEDENGEVTFISADEYQNELKKNLKLGVLDKQQIELKAKALLKSYQSRMDSADVASQLLSIYNDIKNIDENGNHAKPKVEKLASEIYDNIVSKVSNGEVYDQLTDILKGNKMIWDESVKSAFDDDWNSFIRKNRHKLNLVKADSGKGGIGIDVMYDILCRELPGYFDGEAKGAKAQLNEILDVLNSQQFVYDTFLDSNKEEIINQIASDIYGGFAQIDYLKKGSEKAKAQKDYAFDKEYLDEYGIDEKRYKADMRKQINEKSADFVKEQKRRYKNGEISASQFADSLTEHFARVSLSAKIKPIESYYKASNKYRDRFKKINERTTKNLKELRSMLQNPTEGKYIPADLVDLVQNVLNIGDNQNFDLRDKLKRYRDTLSRADIDESVLDVYKQAIDKCEDELSKQNLGQVFAEISRKYNDYKNGEATDTQAGEFEQSFYCYHDAVAKKLIQVAATLENADMTRLTMRQAEALDEGLNCLTHFVKNSVKAIGLTESAHIAEVGHDMIQETKATAVHKNFVSKMLNTAINAELSPERMFRRLGGYKADSMWSKMADMLTDGQTQSEFIKQRLKDVIAPVLDGENMKNADNARSYKQKDLVDIGLVDENGEAVKVPHSFMISAYLHLQNEANQNHALKGGFEIPDFRAYYKGKIANSFSEGKIKARFTDVNTALSKLSQNMSEYDKLVAQNVALLFDKHTKSEYNKINMDVFGFEKAKVKHYFPIYTSKDFVASGFDTAFDTSLKNQGNMKSRIEGAANPIKLMDVFDVVDKEISRCGEYCGKLKAEITMTRVYNTVTAEFGTSLKEQVGLHFGESGKKYIEHLMQDYSGTRQSENSVALSKLRGAVATSALMGNINVAMKQAGSYPTAAATIGWKPLLKALGVSDEGAKVFYRANRQLIDKYTPWLRYRTEGYSTQEIADLKNLSFYNKRQMKWLFGWINAADIATVGRLWQAAEYYVDDNNTELKKGTDEYYKQVAKVFNKIIFDTQPNYTVMQRPDILRNPNSLLKSMIMFSTQPLQNLGILYDSAMNYNAQLKAFKQGKVDKNVLIQAKRGLARGISSVAVSGVVISIMTLLAKALTGRMDDYLDEYGDLNWESVLKGSIGVFGSTMAGMVTFGSEIYNFIMSAATSETYYGLNISSIDLIGDTLESFINEINALKKQEDVLNKTVSFVEKIGSLCGFPARNIKNLFGGITNLIRTGDWFALNEKKKDSQYYAQMYDCCINGDSEKYNQLYNELLDRGKSVNEIESGIKKCLKEAEIEDITEAAEALNDEDYKIYDDIVDELVSRGFDEKLVISAIDEVADTLNGEDLTAEQQKIKEKSKYTYLKDLLKSVNFKGMTAEQKASVQQYAENVADEYGYQAATGKVKNDNYAEAIKYDKNGKLPIESFVVAKMLTSSKFADTDGNGYVSKAEKNAAINKAKFSSDIKSILRKMDII